MDNQNTEAKDLIVKAREALRHGDKASARAFGEQAALLAPEMEDVWLVLAASEPNPEDALAYAQQALEINPSSERALKAVEWAIAQLKRSQAAAVAETPIPAPVPVPAPVQAEAAPAEKKSNSWIWILGAALLGLLLCFVIIYAAYTGVTRLAIGSALNSSAAVPTQENLWAPMQLAKPSAAPVSPAPAQQAAATAISGITLTAPTTAPTDAPGSGSAPDQAAPTTAPADSPGSGSAPGQAAPTTATTDAAGSGSALGQAVAPSSTPQVLPTEAANSTAATSAPAEIPADAATTTPQITETPGVMSMQIIEDTPTSQYVAPSSSAALPAVASAGSGARWIDVDLTNQRVYAYEGQTVVNSFIVSTGTWLHPTVTGQYNIYVKYRSAPMSGPGYYLPNVPYIMYFYKGYGLHGTYWHNNFGTPMSHGCVNLRTDEAGWLYNWASVGTLVNVHY